MKVSVVIITLDIIIVNTAGIAKLGFENIFKWFSLHKKIVSDHASQFTFAFTRELARLLQYDVALSLAYHPPSMEKWNATTKNSKYISIFFAKANLELLMAKFADNAAIHLVTGKFPLEESSFQLLSSNST